MIVKSKPKFLPHAKMKLTYLHNHNAQLHAKYSKLFLNELAFQLHSTIFNRILNVSSDKNQQ